MTRPRRVVFLDTETTGLVRDAEPWDVALIARTPAGDIETQLYLTVDETTADLRALQVGHYFDRHPEGHRAGDAPGTQCTDHHVAAQQIAAITHDATLVGVNPAYDMAVLDRFLTRNGYQPSWDYRPYDLSAVTTGLVMGAGYDPDGSLTGEGAVFRSHTLSELVGVPVPADDERHTAMGDTRWARDWYDAVQGIAARVRSASAVHHPSRGSVVSSSSYGACAR